MSTSPDVRTDRGGVAPPPRQRLTARPWFKPAIGISLLAIILFAAPVLGWVTASGKIDDGIDRTSETVNVNVKLFFEPKQFHRETLSELGVFAGRSRDDTTVLRLRAVTQDDLESISRLFWVESITPG